MHPSHPGLAVRLEAVDAGALLVLRLGQAGGLDALLAHLLGGLLGVAAKLLPELVQDALLGHIRGADGQVGWRLGTLAGVLGVVGGGVGGVVVAVVEGLGVLVQQEAGFRIHLGQGHLQFYVVDGLPRGVRLSDAGRIPEDRVAVAEILKVAVKALAIDGQLYPLPVVGRQEGVDHAANQQPFLLRSLAGFDLVLEPLIEVQQHQLGGLVLGHVEAEALQGHTAVQHAGLMEGVHQLHVQGLVSEGEGGQLLADQVFAGGVRVVEDGGGADGGGGVCRVVCGGGAALGAGGFGQFIGAVDGLAGAVAASQAVTAGQGEDGEERQRQGEGLFAHMETSCGGTSRIQFR